MTIWVVVSAPIRTAPCWCAMLVRNDAQFFAFLCQAAHGQQEALAVRAVNPTGSQDQMGNSCCLDRLFIGELAAAIHIDRTGRIVLCMVHFLAIENVSVL